MIQEMIDGMAVKINAEKAQNMLNELGLNLIRQFAEGQLAKVDSTTYGLRLDYRTLQDLMEQAGFTTENDLDLNGWENDYLETYIYRTASGLKKACLCGTMANGDFSLKWEKVKKGRKKYE